MSRFSLIVVSIFTSITSWVGREGPKLMQSNIFLFPLPPRFFTKTTSVLQRKHQALRFSFSSCQYRSCLTVCTGQEFPHNGMNASTVWPGSKACTVATCCPAQRLQPYFGFEYIGSYYKNITFKKKKIYVLPQQLLFLTSGIHSELETVLPVCCVVSSSISYSCLSLFIAVTANCFIIGTASDPDKDGFIVKTSD